jgi:hypothetical protein
MLERRAVKVACVVLRGLGEGDLAWLPVLALVPIRPETRRKKEVLSIGQRTGLRQ